MTSKSFLNRASWAILFFLLVPAGAVQASKDAIPGDKAYPVKLMLEDALLMVMKPSSAATSDMEMKFTKRRLLEVEQVTEAPLVIESLKSLNEQVADTTTSIGKVKNLDKQAELVDEYMQTLQVTQASLTKQQATVDNLIDSDGTANQAPKYYYQESTPNTTGETLDVDNKTNPPASTQTNSTTNAQVEVQQQLATTQAEIAAELERLRQVALVNEQLRQQQQAEATAQEAQKQQQEAEKQAVERQKQEVKAAQKRIEEEQEKENQKKAQQEEKEKQKKHQQQLEQENKNEGRDGRHDD